MQRLHRLQRLRCLRRRLWRLRRLPRLQRLRRQTRLELQRCLRRRDRFVTPRQGRCGRGRGRRCLRMRREATP